MTEEAIQKDVSDEVAENATEDTVEPTAADARLDAIEALAEQRETEILAEANEEVIDESEEAAEEPTETEEDPEQEELVRVKVDGEEIELPISEVVKGYQKDATASKRLEQAAAERQELDAMRDELNARANKPAEELPDEGANSKLAEEIRSLYDDISVGTDEEVIEANKKLQGLLSGRGDNPAIQNDQVVSQAAQQVRQQIEYDSARSQFVDDYQDIANDPTLYQMAENVLSEAIPKSRTYEEAFKTAGDTIRQWKDGLTGTQNVVSDKVTLKERLPKEPVSTGARAIPQPQKKPETPSDIILAMKASRGQPT